MFEIFKNKKLEVGVETQEVPAKYFFKTYLGLCFGSNLEREGGRDFETETSKLVLYEVGLRCCIFLADTFRVL